MAKGKHHNLDEIRGLGYVNDVGALLPPRNADKDVNAMDPPMEARERSGPTCFGLMAPPPGPSVDPDHLLHVAGRGFGSWDSTGVLPALRGLGLKTRIRFRWLVAFAIRLRRLFAELPATVFFLQPRAANRNHGRPSA